MTGPTIRSAAVLGAGTMGAQIAAHLANAGVPVTLLDLTADVARDGLKRASALKPDPFFTRDRGGLITLGGFDKDLGLISSADWIVEAVVERLEIKRPLFERVEGVRAAGAIVSSNTSGIPIAALAEGRSVEFRRHFLGTHFFNPPRYLRLVEVIPLPDTMPDVVTRITEFADHRLGKGVVVTKDTPSFIANRIGLYGVIQAIRALESGDYTIEEIDAITGPALGRPRSATFRTLDIAGIDVFGHVARDLRERAPDAETARAFEMPRIVQSLIDRGWFGEKTGQGFYKRVGSEITTLDPASFSYRPLQPARLPALDAARSIEDPAKRFKALFEGRDKVGAFLRSALAPTLIYTAQQAPSIAYSIDDIDRAMHWGFGWALGPFELWDAVGIREMLDASPNEAVPQLVSQTLAQGRDRFRTGALPPAGPGLEILRTAKEQTQVVRSNAGASLVDLGDGVLAVEFHSKLNSLGGDAIQMIREGLKQTAGGFRALVIGNDAPDFSAGANLTLVLLEAQEGRWDEIDAMVRAFQEMTQAIRYADVPVVVAPAGRTLGGGCEIALHADRVQAAAETYMGLVEVGVGLIPAGGGAKEMVARATRDQTGVHPNPFSSVQSAFETIALAKVSTSATHAIGLSFLRDCDGITMNRDRLMNDAKNVALARARNGFQRPRPEKISVGGESTEAALKLGVHLAWRAGRISDYDALIGRTIAHVMAGGTLPHPALVSEAHLLDLEREAFLKLCGHPKTLERIQYTLKTGKTLRN
jgi:3-hydroxyacyl-CoA dehydrogenase